MKKNYIYGENTVKEFIKSKKRLKKVFLTANRRDIISYCKAKKIDFAIKPTAFFKKISLHSQNIAAEVFQYEYYSLDYIKKLDQSATILILDEIQDPQNFGAIVRSAAAANAQAIIIADKRQVDINSTVERTSVGTTNKIPIIKVANITNTIIKLKKEDFWIYGATLAHNSIDYRKPNYKGKCAIVIGSEGSGIKPAIQKNCDQLISIPLSNNVESLNASVAGALILYHVYNQKFPYLK